ncbi:exodeoxyribonuclease VII large subunit [Candidatus Poriferisodalis sp.]|uniref:exodeoxyribonuclease VII large subunit n=1 Tax=Candidatus Poriferisodalis sp. TaxID=3101277 RepID=UPI003B59E583
MSSAVEGFEAVAGDDAPQPDGTWSVSDLAAAIEETIRLAFSSEVWVRGEIIGYSQAASGHIYFNLIEPGMGKDRRGARMRVALFKGRQRFVNRDLAAGGGLTLDDGIEVRIRAEVEYYAGSGQVQLIMSGVDPHFTLGVLAADRERTLAELAASGLLRRNAAVPLPLVPLRVGLITAAGSAAHADFIHELSASGYAFEVLLCDARVQGVTAEADLVAALRTLGSAEVDVIAVVRGGGDRTDLLAFDLASVAKAIATCPLPVFCGIGHEIDTSVADQVAHTAAKTPTACAAALIAHVASFDERLVRARRELHRTARSRAAAAAARLAAARGALGLLTERRLGRPRARLGQARLRLAHRAERRVSEAHAQLRSAAAVIAALAPQRTLARGFSITRAADGAVVRSMPAAGATITTQTLDAEFASTVNAPTATSIADPTDRGTDNP